MNEKNTKNTKLKKKPLSWNGFIITYLVVTVGGTALAVLSYIIEPSGAYSGAKPFLAAVGGLFTGTFIFGGIAVIRLIFHMLK